MFRSMLSVLMLTLLAPQALAVDGVTVTPGVAYVQGTGTGLVTVRWTIEVTVPSDQTVTITSASGTLSAGAAPPVAVGGTLRRTVRLTAGTHDVRITERLRIDRTSARYILEGSTGSYSRTFTDTLTGSANATVGLVGRASGSGGLTLQNLDLTFDDGAAFRNVGQGEALTARASISTSGRGIVKAKWEIAGPNGGFRTLRRVSFTAGGPTATEVESPPLPTDQPGQFRLRFVIDGNGQGFDDTTIRYAVGSGGGLAAIGLTGPAEGATLASRTRFQWEPVAGAERYRIEFLAEADLQVLAAVETAKPSALVRSFTFDRLTTGAPLAWRVVALDDSGAVIARSAQRRIGIP
jgi:hypothetical protein